MSDEQAFLRTIIDHPDDDTPRLVFADWLQENGQEDRAEFIRAQIALAKLTEDSPERRELAYRCRQLLDAHEEEWIKPLKKVGARDCRFHRGFVEAFTRGWLTFETKAETLFSITPVRQFQFRGNENDGRLTDLSLLDKIPSTHHLHTLDLTGNNLRTEYLAQITEFTHLQDIPEWVLMFNAIDDEGAALLREHPFFQQAKLIRCGANPFTDTARERLRNHFGDRVSFECERDPDYLYAIQNEPDRFNTGFAQDHTQVMLLAWPDEVRAAIFDHAGNLLQLDQRLVKDGENPDEIEQGWMNELALQSATIKVKQFRFANGEGIFAYPRYWAEIFNEPNHPERELVLDWLADWHFDGQFVWDYIGDNYWLNREGEVTDT